ncbi:MAG: sigma-54-dependent Fis family transcriptional regulator [Polyangiaceae bacterium]
MLDPLLLDHATEGTWLDFQAKHPRGIAFGAHLPVVGHWERSRSLGAPIDGPKPEDALTRGNELRERAERIEPVLHDGFEVLQRTAASVGGQDYMLLVSDMDGVIVSANGGGAFAPEARRVLLMEGASWNESVRGTNAIGTAIAAGRPVIVHGTAHFARPYHGLVCYAAPVHDADGTPVAVLDATSLVSRADNAIASAVMAAASALTELLRLRAYSLAGAAVTRALGRSLERMNCPVALVEPPGRVSRLNSPARELFTGSEATRDVGALLGLDFQQLTQLALSATTLEVYSPVSGRAHRVHAEPIESGGRVIALLVFMDPATRLSTIPPPPRVPRAPRRDAFSEIFAEDKPTRTALDWAARIAASDIPIMLLAETGSGKELLASAIHAASNRAAGPFVAVNCGSFTPSLLESELFGYAPGAFTGAEKGGRHGLLHAARGGTLFLDEVGEMPLAMQAALLRFLESGTYHRVGETKQEHADVRVLCATCRDLPGLVEGGSFRKDLYYRLKGATVTLPPLRSRSDGVNLARHLLAQLAAKHEVVPTPTLSREVEGFIERHAWPGNVRELKSTLDVALVLSQGSASVELLHLPPDLLEDLEPAPPSTAAENQLQEAQGWAVRRALQEVAGNVSLAAKRLGVARSTLYRMMRRHGVDLNEVSKKG